jgi:hypothetical protein
MSQSSTSTGPTKTTWDNAFLLTTFAVFATGVLVSLKRFLPIHDEEAAGDADD